LQASIQLPPEFRSKVTGLLGNFNGNATDDFQMRNGSLLPHTATEREIFSFGQTWQIPQSDSTFFPYFGSDTRDSFCDSAFTPVFVTDYRDSLADMFHNSSMFTLANQVSRRVR
jgi:hypothetical protein